MPCIFFTIVALHISHLKQNLYISSKSCKSEVWAGGGAGGGCQVGSWIRVSKIEIKVSASLASHLEALGNSPLQVSFGRLAESSSLGL